MSELTETEANELRASVRHRLATYLLEQTRDAVSLLFEPVPERWGGAPNSSEKLGLPELRITHRHVAVSELQRIAVRVVNPGTVFSDEAIDEELELQERA